MLCPRPVAGTSGCTTATLWHGRMFSLNDAVASTPGSLCRWQWWLPELLDAPLVPFVILSFRLSLGCAPRLLQQGDSSSLSSDQRFLEGKRLEFSLQTDLTEAWGRGSGRGGGAGLCLPLSLGFLKALDSPHLTSLAPLGAQAFLPGHCLSRFDE